jgi:hypothetical protein
MTTATLASRLWETRIPEIARATAPERAMGEQHATGW